MSELEDSSAIPLPLLAQTLARFVDAGARLTEVTSADVQPGMSGALVWRYTIRYTSGGQDAEASLVTKVATRHEWNVLRELNAQQQPNVPFAYSLDESEGDHPLVCMQDVGDRRRPTSLEPISDLELEREATGLASIHAANLEQAARLGWLPKIDRGYLEEMLFQRTWRPAWEQALNNPVFVETFRSAIPRVEAAAATIVEDMVSLLQDAQAQTLIHVDLNPSNVLVQEGKPYFIDWQTARWGPLYLDSPHHHCTLAQAELYRRALAMRGYTIPPDAYAAHYRVAESDGQLVGYIHASADHENGSQYVLPLGAAWRRDSGVEAGVEVEVVLTPEGPQIDALAADILAAAGAQASRANDKYRLWPWLA